MPARSILRRRESTSFSIVVWSMLGWPIWLATRSRTGLITSGRRTTPDCVLCCRSALSKPGRSRVTSAGYLQGFPAFRSFRRTDGRVFLRAGNDADLRCTSPVAFDNPAGSATGLLAERRLALRRKDRAHSAVVDSTLHRCSGGGDCCRFVRRHRCEVSSGQARRTHCSACPALDLLFHVRGLFHQGAALSCLLLDETNGTKTQPRAGANTG